jgi:hypothetical protein
MIDTSVCKMEYDGYLHMECEIYENANVVLEAAKIVYIVFAKHFCR